MQTHLQKIPFSMIEPLWNEKPAGVKSTQISETLANIWRYLDQGGILCKN